MNLRDSLFVFFLRAMLRAMKLRSEASPTWQSTLSSCSLFPLRFLLAYFLPNRSVVLLLFAVCFDYFSLHIASLTKTQRQREFSCFSSIFFLLLHAARLRAKKIFCRCIFPHDFINKSSSFGGLIEDECNVFL